ncbi:hypothetical protein [Paracraurococcus lichenis]|uniref:Uncharacterized protein n=1 Tax=Paracraurococcus lichenis TaxID=3064888 RepID=A0ABT9ED82_9PROT|nr:hypothetical protein [Paracraurococcus sp. LOR1-02]MDO9714186.1 hypothetical protein [Paracraurococcus sp. LOR1-02]
MAKQDDGTKPTLEDVDRMILDHERKNAADQRPQSAVKQRAAKDPEPTKDVHFKKGESLWDRLGREIDAADESQNKS